MQIVGLLHDVVEDTPRSIQDVRYRFGETIAEMVQALTEDVSIHNYAQRKQALRVQVIGAGTTVMDIALADKIASLQHARITATRVRRRKLAHCDATLQLAAAAGAGVSGSLRGVSPPFVTGGAMPVPRGERAAAGAQFASPWAPEDSTSSGHGALPASC